MAKKKMPSNKVKPKVRSKKKPKPKKKKQARIHTKAMKIPAKFKSLKEAVDFYAKCAVIYTKTIQSLVEDHTDPADTQQKRYDMIYGMNREEYLIDTLEKLGAEHSIDYLRHETVYLPENPGTLQDLADLIMSDPVLETTAPGRCRLAMMHFTDIVELTESTIHREGTASAATLELLKQALHQLQTAVQDYHQNQ